MQRKKLLFVVTKGNWGGAQKYIFDLATHLPKERFDIAVVFGVPGILKQRLEENNIRTIVVTSLGRDVNPFLDIAAYKELVSIFKREMPDIVHLNSSKIGGIGSLAARRARVKNIIFTAHGWAFNEDRNIFSKLIIWTLSWLTVIFSHHVIVLGNKEKQQACRMPGARKKIIKIYNGINVREFTEKDAARQEIARNVSIPETLLNVPWIATVSELHPNKGLLFVLRALESISTPFIFIIIGSGEQKKELEEYITSHNLAHKVFLAGYVSGAADLLRAFDIFTLTSVKEGLPYAILEAGSAGLPVIASSVGNIPEIIISDKSGLLVPPKNVPAISEAIQKLLADKTKCEEYGLTLKQYVATEFSFKNMLGKTLAVYES
jgi:glycosyltransferase involved in cell wall biosynthesis